MTELTIDEEFRSLLTPLTDAERSRLEANIVADGCRVPLVAWPDGESRTIVDGHNRYEICRKNNLPFQVEERHFSSRGEALAWIANEHLGRRNITPEQVSYLRGKSYNSKKPGKGRPPKTHQCDALSRKRLAEQHNVGEATITRDGKFAESLDLLAGLNADLPVKPAALKVMPKSEEGGQSKSPPLNRSAVTKLAKMCDGDEGGASLRLGLMLNGNESLGLKPGASLKQVENVLAAEAIRAEPPALPEGPFRVIVADPPWKYDNRENDASHRAANPYPSMTIEEIKALPVAGMAHDDAILWMWTTNGHIRHAWEIIEAWGFKYKTILTWVKDRMGTGDWLRGQTEHCVLAVRGKPVIVLKNQTTCIRGPLREHSRKPEEFYQLVDAMCPGSKCELFSRSQRDGWTSHGNQQRLFHPDA